MPALQVFTRALEKATGHTYISAITFMPLRMPAYKEVHCTLKQVSGVEEIRKTYTMKYLRRITNDDEKATVLADVSEEFIAYIIGELLKSKEA